MRACWNPQILPRWTPTGYRGRAIARLIFNTAHGRSINEKHSEMSVEWRGCHRTMWTRADPGPLRADGREISAEDMEAIKDVQDMRDATGMEDKSQAQTEKECAKQRTYVQLLSNCLQAAQRVCAGDLSTLANNLPANVLSARGCAPVQRGTTSEQVDFLLTALKTPVQTDAAGAPAAAAPAGASPATASAAATNDGASEVKTRADPFGAFATVTAADYEELAQQWKSTPWPRCPPPLNMEQRSAMRPVLEYLIQYTKWTRQSRAMRAVDPAAALPPRPQAPLVLVHAEPGAGKSLMLTALCKWVEEHSEGLLRTSCCAMTGSAATLIPDGKTVFTLLGIPARVKKEDDGSLICPLAQGIKTATKMALSQLCNPLLGDGWTAGALACDEVSQFTPDMLADVDCRMKEGTCDEYKHLDFGGHCVVLFGDFFQKMPTHGKSLPKAMIEYFVEEMRGAAKSDFEKKYRVDSARARGVHLFRKFKLVTLPQQMRSQGDVEHIEMIRRWRDIHTTDPQLLSKEYLASLQVYCSKDWLADGQWRHAPVAVVGNLERRVLTPVLLQTFAHDAQQPVLKWRLKRIVSATKGSITSKEKRSMRQARSKAALATMKDEDLSQLYAYEPGMWGRLVPGADAVVLDNVAVAKKVANGSPCKMLALGYYDDNTGRQVATLAAGGKAGEELEVPEPDYVVVEFTGADAVDTYKDSTLMVGRAIVAFPQSTFVPTEIPTRSEFAAERGVWSVPMKSPPVELALIRTDYKEQGRSEPRLVLSLMSSGVMPHLDAFGLYVLLTRATRGRESIRLLLPENAKPEVALQHLLGSNFQRDPHLVSHLRGYDVDGNWDVELASTAWKMVGTDSSGGKRKRAAPSGGSKGATGSAAGQPSKARKAPATKDPSLAHMFMQKRLPPPRPCPPANPSIQVCYPRSLPARVCCTDCMLNCHRFEASLEDRA